MENVVKSWVFHQKSVGIFRKVSPENAQMVLRSWEPHQMKALSSRFLKSTTLWPWKCIWGQENGINVGKSDRFVMKNPGFHNIFHDFPTLMPFSCPQMHFHYHNVVLFRKQELKAFIWWGSQLRKTICAFSVLIFPKMSFFGTKILFFVKFHGARCFKNAHFVRAPRKHFLGWRFWCYKRSPNRLCVSLIEKISQPLLYPS